MKFTNEAVIDAPSTEVDLEQWLFNLSDEDYQAASKSHRAAGNFTQDGVRGSVNVEDIGGTLMIQHYKEVSAAPNRVEMLSKRSRAYIFHLIPVPAEVRWTMSAAPRTADTTTFTCTVEIDLPTPLRIAAATIGTPYFVRKHVAEETPLFAADINRKIAAAS